MHKVIAEPAGVNVLKGMESDGRVVENLANGRNNGRNELDSWLAPYKNTKSYQKSNTEDRQPNWVLVVFEEP